MNPERADWLRRNAAWLAIAVAALAALTMAFLAVFRAPENMAAPVFGTAWAPYSDALGPWRDGGLSFLLGLFLNQLIILLVHRARPYDAGLTHLLIPPSTDSSFPSDHATAAFSVVFAYLLHRRFRKALFFAMAGALVAFSRVYLGTHYVGDILGAC